MADSKESIWIERFSRYEGELRSIYDSIYHNEQSYRELIVKMKSIYDERKESFSEADKIGDDWILSKDTVGMMLYVDLFSGDLKGLAKKVDYFKSLGITLIHLMPLLKPREGENDGGYAVQNYREIDPKIGNMDDFKEVIQVFHKEGIKVCIDFVMNHTAKEHEWAQQAIRGIEPYKGFYFIYDSYNEPWAFEQTVPQVFPKVAPGNFTYYDEFKKWVFTSFYEFQWDLNYWNPLVFNAMAENMLYFANIGVDMLRLDAIPFIWKELGTKCRNLPKVHDILRMFQIVAKMVAPATALLGEAIVQPVEIVKYFGYEDKIECNIMYNASYMVDIWNALATKDARFLNYADKWPIPEGTTWINYARCHDDIGWGIEDYVLRNLGYDPYSHKQFLIYFYNGTIWDSFARGRLYEFDPITNDARNSGTLASLAGLEKAIYEKDVYQKELALKRIKMIHAITLFSQGMPMIYSGDESGAINDYRYETNPQKSHDSRWLHRGYFDWEDENFPDPVKKTIFEDVKKFIEMRKSSDIFSGKAVQTNMLMFNKHVFGFIRKLPNNELNPMIALFNFSDDKQVVGTHDIRANGTWGKKTELFQGKTVDLDFDTLLMGPYEFLILQ